MGGRALRRCRGNVRVICGGCRRGQPRGRVEGGTARRNACRVRAAMRGKDDTPPTRRLGEIASFRRRGHDGARIRVRQTRSDEFSRAATLDAWKRASVAWPTRRGGRTSSALPGSTNGASELSTSYFSAMKAAIRTTLPASQRATRRRAAARRARDRAAGVARKGRNVVARVRRAAARRRAQPRSAAPAEASDRNGLRRRVIL